MSHARPVATVARHRLTTDPMTDDAALTDDADLISPWSWPAAPDLPVETPALTYAELHERVPAHAAAYASPIPTTPRPPRAKRPRASTGNPASAVLAAVVAATVGALTWAVAAQATGHELGFVAIGLGALVGVAVRRFGGPSRDQQVFVAAFWTFLGVVLGFYAETIASGMKVLHIGLVDALQGAQWTAIATDLATAPMHWVFALLAVAAAVRTLRP